MANERPGPAEVVAFWRDAGPKQWFLKDDAFDAWIGERFGALHMEAAAGAKNEWAQTSEGSLALLLLLDQFSRNLYRGSPQAFAQDEQARRIARSAIDAGFDQAVDPAFRTFFYLPFTHSESIIDQELCVRLSHQILDPDSLRWARIHEKIIRRFGRFPHRNKVLGRHTTPAEQAFLDGGGFSG
jgi:uncharacterized protein (DUF924 family)